MILALKQVTLDGWQSKLKACQGFVAVIYISFIGNRIRKI